MRRRRSPVGVREEFDPELDRFGDDDARDICDELRLESVEL